MPSRIWLFPSVLGCQRALQSLVIVHLILTSAGVALGAISQNWIPAPLQEWQHLNLRATIDALGSTGLIFAATSGVILLCSIIVGSIGLLLLQRWGALLHVAGTAGFAVLFCFVGTVIDHSLNLVLASLHAILQGVIYGFAFFTPALARAPKA